MKPRAITPLPSIGMVILLPLSPPPVMGIPDPDELLRFDELMTALDVGAIKREGWDEMKATLAQAILHSRGGDGDDVAGLQGFVRLLRKWERSRFYDGGP